MGDFARFQEPVWDRFFDFVYDCEDSLTDAQIDDELRRRGIEMTRAFGRVRQALHSARARAELEAARGSRPGLLRQLKGLTEAATGAARDELRRLIMRASGGSLQPAYFRRLESAASEEDLRSLLQDIRRLDALTGDSGDAGPKAE